MIQLCHISDTLQQMAHTRETLTHPKTSTVRHRALLPPQEEFLKLTHSINFKFPRREAIDVDITSDKYRIRWIILRKQLHKYFKDEIESSPLTKTGSLVNVSTLQKYKVLTQKVTKWRPASFLSRKELISRYVFNQDRKCMQSLYKTGQAANKVTGYEQNDLISNPSKDKERSSILHILQKAQPNYSGHSADVTK